MFYKRFYSKPELAIKIAYHKIMRLFVYFLASKSIKEFAWQAKKVGSYCLPQNHDHALA
jgi:hypothetical protein